MALLLPAIALGAACFFSAAYIKRAHAPATGSGLYLITRAGYLAGWVWTVLAGMLVIVGMINLLKSLAP